MTAFYRHTVLPFSPNDIPTPIQRRCLAPSQMEVTAKYPIQTVIQLLRAKKKPVAYTTTPARRLSPYWCLFGLRM